MAEPGETLDEKLERLQERTHEIQAFTDSLQNIKTKLLKKKQTIKDIIQAKIEENQRELNKWKELLFIVVDESLDEKIEKLDQQRSQLHSTQKDMEKILESKQNQAGEESDSDSEDLKIDDFLALDLNLQPEGLSATEPTEMESAVKKEFNTLMNELKKSLRRTFAYVGGIIRGFLRRGKSNVNWIKIMRKLEGRELEERMVDEYDPYIGTKLSFGEADALTKVEENVSNTWNSVASLFQNRHKSDKRDEFVNNMYQFYEKNPEDVQFYMPQLIYFLLTQYTEFQPLMKFFLDKCKESVHFALQAYLLVRAAKDSREPTKKKKVIPPSIIRWRVLCNQLLADIQTAAALPRLTAEGSSPLVPPKLNDREAGPIELSSEEPFHRPIQFMDELVRISEKLGMTSPDQYSTEMNAQLGKLNGYLQKMNELYPRSFAYIPLLKMGGSSDFHKVVRITPNEAFPIPTYGRVLYYVWMEVVDIPKAGPERPISSPEAEKEKSGSGGEKRKKKDNDSASDDKEEKKEEIRTSRDKLKRSQSDIRIKKSEAALDDEKDRPAIKEEEQTSPSEPQLSILSPSKKKERKKDEKKKKSKDDSESATSPAPGSDMRSSSGGSVEVIEIANSMKDKVVRPKSYWSQHPIGSHPAFGELYERKSKRIRKESPYGHLEGWRMQPLIVKYGEEVLQEEFAMQLIVLFQRIFLQSKVPVKLVPYRILAVSSKSGLIEPVPNSLSLDKLKKQHTNLLNFFIQAFGEPSEPSFKQAQSNFVKTMAAYSVVCYLLQIKDRHNGNILVDAFGHIIHIDFGYFLSKVIKFEKAPFKLTNEFLEVMGGYGSPCFKQYVSLCQKCYLAARKHSQEIVQLVEMTMEGKGKKVLPCLQGRVTEELLARFHLDWDEEKCKSFIVELVEEARGSWRTVVYDAYQLILNNIH